MRMFSEGHPSGRARAAVEPSHRRSFRGRSGKCVFLRIALRSTGRQNASRRCWHFGSAAGDVSQLQGAREWIQTSMFPSHLRFPREPSPAHTHLTAWRREHLPVGLASLVGQRPQMPGRRRARKRKAVRARGRARAAALASVNGSASAIGREQQLLHLINEFRADNGALQPLALQPQSSTGQRCAASTRRTWRHAATSSMSVRTELNHFERMEAAGYPGVPLSENIYKGSGPFKSAAEAFDAWKNSTDGHREAHARPSGR